MVYMVSCGFQVLGVFYEGLITVVYGFMQVLSRF